MYNKNNLAIAKVASQSMIKRELASVAFYGNRTVATDSFSLVEMSASGEAHDPVLYPANVLKSVKLKPTETLTDEDIPVKALEGIEYPEIDRVIDDHYGRLNLEEYATIKINAEYLERVLSILKRVDGTFKQVELSVPRDNQYRPVLITAECKKEGKEQKARAIVMPFNK